MRSPIYKAGADGIIKGLPAGHGLQLVPALPLVRAREIGDLPGNFPARVYLDGKGEPHEIPNADALFFAEPFKSWEVRNVAAGSYWLCRTFSARHSGVLTAPAKQRAVVQLQAAAAVATAAPVGLVGIEITPALKSLNLYFAGTPRTVTLHVRSLGGVWHVAHVFDAADMPGAEFRFVDFAGGRLYFQADGAGCTLELDAEVEVG